MSNQLYKQFPLSLVPQVVHLYGRATIAASGAPTLVLPDSLGMATLVRTATGAYTLTLKEQFTGFLDLKVTYLLASGAPTTIAHSVVAQTVTTSKTIQFLTLDAAGAAADPDSGAQLFIELKLRRGTLKK